ncbi:MAG: glycoside hydrolase family 28 protein [Bacteroidales bacterium]
MAAMKKITFFKTLTVILFTAVACSNHDGIYTITRFGAKGDGLKINTASINRAIEKCSNDGGGTVIVPRGKFITGTIVLRSNVHLHLNPGAFLIGSTDTADYLRMPDVQFHEGYSHYGLIFAENASNISITGAGELLGNGTFFMNGIEKPHTGSDFDRQFTRQKENFMKEGDIFEDGPVSYAYRPGILITFEQCERINISGVTIKDSPEWTMRISDCEDVEINGISIINNKLIPNSDGIHTTSSRNVRISNCNIFAGDDAIIVTGFGKSQVPDDPERLNYKPQYGNKTGIAENVTVTNCVLSSRSACIRIGYGKHSIKNLVFSNLVMYDSNRGIGIFARDGGNIDNVLFSNIVIQTRLHSGHWWGKGEPIHISACRQTENGIPGKISNIRFEGIIASSEAGILISGCRESVISNVTLSDISLKIRNGKYTGSYGGNFDLRPAWPISAALFSHDIPGIYAGYVNNLKIKDFRLTWDEGLPDFFTEGIFAENFSGILLEGVEISHAHKDKKEPAIRMINGENAVLSGLHTSKQNIPFVMVNVK